MNKIGVRVTLRFARHLFSQVQSRLLRWREIVPLLVIGQVLELLIGPAQLAANSRMRGKAILAGIQLRGAHDDQLLQPGG